MRVNVEQVLRTIHEQPDPIIQAELIEKAILAGIRVVQIARELDMSSSYVSHLRRLKKLPALIINGYYDKTISLSHLFILSRLGTVEEMTRVYEDILTNNLSASQTERRVFELLSGKKVSGKKLPKVWFDEFERKIRAISPMLSVTTIQTRRKGQITITFNGSFEQTSLIYERIKIQINKDS